MISLETLILLLVVAGLAFYAGLQFGRQQAQNSERVQRAGDNAEGRGAMPTPIAAAPKPVTAPRGAPPPASAGSGGASSPGATDASTLPRRSTPPPPASAALMQPSGKPKS